MKKRISEEELEALRAEEQNAKPEDPDNTKSEAKNGGQKSVTIYISILFAAVLILILISYFIQQRNSAKAISDLTQSHSQFSSQAMENIEELQDANLAYAVQVQELQDQVEELQQELTAAQEETASAQEKNDALTERLNETSLQYDTLCALLEMQAAVEAGDNETALAKSRIVEAAVSYLSDEHTALYEELLKEIQK